MNKRALLLKYLNAQTHRGEEEAVLDLLIHNDMETRNFCEIFWIGGPEVKLLNEEQTLSIKQEIMDRIEETELRSLKPKQLYDEAK